MSHDKYDPDTVKNIRRLYIAVIVIWIAIVWLLDIWTTKGGLILILPVLIFLWNWYSAPSLSPSTEDHMFSANYLSIGIILALPLLNWLGKEYNSDKMKFTSVVVVSIIVSFIPHVDVWFPEKNLSVYKHFQSAFQVMSLILFMYELTHYLKVRTPGKLL